MKMILDDKNPRIRGCEFYETYISCDSRVPGESFKLSHGPRFSWEDRPTSKASSFCKTQPSNCGKVPLSFSSFSSCFLWSHVSRAEAWLCLFFWVVGEILKSHFWDFLCDLWPVFSHFVHILVRQELCQGTLFVQRATRRRTFLHLNKSLFGDTPVFLPCYLSGCKPCAMITYVLGWFESSKSGFI